MGREPVAAPRDGRAQSGQRSLAGVTSVRVFAAEMGKLTHICGSRYLYQMQRCRVCTTDRRGTYWWGDKIWEANKT